MNSLPGRLRFLSGVFLLSPGLLSCGKNQKDPPNFLIVFPDQQRGSTLAFNGKEPVITPHIDKFAGESLVLTNAVSNYLVSSPFRAMLMTGKYALSDGVVSNCTSESAKYNVNLRETDTTWPDVLKSNGYSLGYIGEWHLESPFEPFVDCSNNKGKIAWNEWTPPVRRHGFDFWYAYYTYDDQNHPLYWNTTASREGSSYVNEWGKYNRKHASTPPFFTGICVDAVLRSVRRKNTRLPRSPVFQVSLKYFLNVYISAVMA